MVLMFFWFDYLVINKLLDYQYFFWFHRMSDSSYLVLHSRFECDGKCGLEDIRGTVELKA